MILYPWWPKMVVLVGVMLKMKVWSLNYYHKMMSMAALVKMKERLMLLMNVLVVKCPVVT